METLEKENKEKKAKKEPEGFKVAADAGLDRMVNVESLEADKYHKTGDKFQVGKRVAERLAKEGKVKILAMIALLLSFAFASEAQIIASPRTQGQAYLINLENTLGTNLTRDTTTNSGTGVLVTDRAITGEGPITIVALVTKVSGTVAGTLVLTGSIDGTNYQTINQPNTQTAVVTVAAVSDATARYSFSLSSNPFRYYKITHTGTGTMVSYLDGALLKHE